MMNPAWGAHQTINAEAREEIAPAAFHSTSCARLWTRLAAEEFVLYRPVEKCRCAPDFVIIAFYEARTLLFEQNTGDTYGQRGLPDVRPWGRAIDAD
jgi:tetrahydromethanopterin S-methyltransferase subunit H